MLYDAHCHLDSVAEEDLHLILAQAHKAGVGTMVSNSTSFASNEKNLLLAQKHPEILPCIGLYPIDLVELSDDEIARAFDYFKKHISEACAVGEVGLDYKFCTKAVEQEKQKKYLRKFVQLVNEHHKPIVLHTRYAQRQVLDILEEEKATQVLLHSFSDSPKLMKKAAELGYFISVGLNITYREDVQNAIKDFPLEHLLLETDAPMKLNGELAYPDKIPLVLAKVAELKNIAPHIVEAEVEKNFKKLFG